MHTDYIEVYNEGRDSVQPLLTLYDYASVRFFFYMLAAAPEVAFDTFRSHQLALIAYSINEVQATGTGLYVLHEDGLFSVIHESGRLAGLLEKAHISKHLYKVVS